MRSRLTAARTTATRASYVGLFTSLGFSVSGAFGWGYPEFPWFFTAHMVATFVAAGLAVLALPRSGLALLVAGLVLIYSAGCLAYLIKVSNSWCHPPTMGEREPRTDFIDYGHGRVHCIGQESGIEYIASFDDLLKRGIPPDG